LESLVGLVQRGVDVKPTLLRVLTDLYVQNPVHTPEEERQYVELALRLIDAVDPATRQAIALRLAGYPAAPPAIIECLAADLPRHPESTPAGAAAPPSFRALPRTAPSPATDASEFTELFFRANAETRRAILDNLQRAGGAPARLPECDKELIARLERAVLGGRPGDFIREIERALEISRGLAERIVNDLSGEPLAVAAKALAMPIEVFQRILLFVNPAIGHSVRRVYGLSALYGEISADTASHLVTLWRAAQPRETARGQPDPARATRDRRDTNRPVEMSRPAAPEVRRQRTT
jgi:hypothetical protein